MARVRVVIIMGVAGSGKSTVGAELAARCGGKFYDADDFHPPENVAKMAAGKPLDDGDRLPWLRRLRYEVVDATREGDLTVLACSALKRRYRDLLGVPLPQVALIYLKGDASLLAERLGRRTGHYMKEGMLDSQLAVLEEPTAEDAHVISIAAPVDEILSAIQSALSLHFSG